MNTDIAVDPITLFRDWFEKASNSNIDKPNAMTLATVDKDGAPCARVVLLSSFDEQGFVFHTNYNSRKGLEIEQDPRVTLLFWWDEPGLQVSIEGRAEKTRPEESDAYFSKRPRGSQLGAWASDQSAVIDSRETLDQRVQEFTLKYQGKPIPRPPHWGGYRVVPQKIEFWENQKNRLHDRILFSRLDSQWIRQLLAP